MMINRSESCRGAKQSYGRDWYEWGFVVGERKRKMQGSSADMCFTRKVLSLPCERRAVILCSTRTKVAFPGVQR